MIEHEERTPPQNPASPSVLLATNARREVRGRRAYLRLGSDSDISRARRHRRLFARDLGRSALQNASDAAALAAGADPAETQAQHLLLAASRAAANLGTTVSTASCLTNSCTLDPVGPLNNIVVERDGRHAAHATVQISAKIDTAVMQLAKFPTLFAAPPPRWRRSRASADSHPLEIALALDNTGSIGAQYPGVDHRGATLADTAFVRGRRHRRVRVSVVPYVAAVNPGLPSLGMIDTTALSIYNGAWFDLGPGSPITPVARKTGAPAAAAARPAGQAAVRAATRATRATFSTCRIRSATWRGTVRSVQRLCRVDQSRRHAQHDPADHDVDDNFQQLKTGGQRTLPAPRRVQFLAHDGRRQQQRRL